jgi:hypothetical protein
MPCQFSDNSVAGRSAGISAACAAWSLSRLLRLEQFIKALMEILES